MHSFIVCFSTSNSNQWLVSLNKMKITLLVIHLEIFFKFFTSNSFGHTVTQAVSRWLPTAAARVRAPVSSCGICDGRSGTGLGLLRVLQFPLPIYIPPVAPQSPSSIIWGWYNRPVVAAVPSGLSLIPLRIIININSEYSPLYMTLWRACLYLSIKQAEHI
jgi:hypothetical protein